MKIIAQSGQGLFMLSVDNKTGFIYVQEKDQISEVADIQIFFKFNGYWEPPKISKAEQDSIIRHLLKRSNKKGVSKNESNV